MPITQTAINNAAALGLRVERLQMLEDWLQQFYKDDKRQAGFVQIHRHGAPVFEGSYGFSTKEYGLKSDTIFHMASITKPVIAILLLILQEDGLVDLTRPVWQYLPEFDGGGREDICVWHLITHTSGIKENELYKSVYKSIEDELGIKKPENGGDWDGYNKQINERLGLAPSEYGRDRLQDYHYLYSLKHTLEHKPRSHMTYCNYGYGLLKTIIQVVTGETIDGFAQRVLFEPLGMADTYWLLPEEKEHRVVGRCERAKGYPYYNENFKNESGSGGLKSTADDIMKLMQMVINGGELNGKRILSRASIYQMCINHNEGVPCDIDDRWSSWGLGWNYKAMKKDEEGMLRSASSLEHGGWGGQKILLDAEKGLAVVTFTVNYVTETDVDPNPMYGPIHNILYSALDD
jgi:CubicO group peptidase (beta-lactamase class C family)